jgi:hypothetical protein
MYPLIAHQKSTKWKVRSALYWMRVAAVVVEVYEVN